MKRIVAVALAACCWAAGVAGAAPVKLFRAQSAAAFAAGDFDGVGLDPLGSLLLAGRATRLAALPEPFLLSACAQQDGWLAGTGNAGKVLRVTPTGAVATAFEVPEPEVFALACEADGTVYAGSSPKGKVYRVAPGGKPEVWFEPHEDYIWALRRAADGALLVATGTQGRLYRVTARGQGSVFYDSEDTHVRALGVLADGRIILGTSGEGLILVVDAAGRARTLYDAPQPEVVGFAFAPDGAVYAAALDSEAALVPPPPEPPKDGGPKPESPVAQPAPVPVVTVETGPDGGRGAKGARSEVLRITAGGTVEPIWSFTEETVYSLLWHADRLWVGTGLEGKIYSWIESRMVLQRDLDERQVIALLPDDPGPLMATTNGAAMYRTTSGTTTGAGERSGTYTSDALDAGQVARFGVFRWRGDEVRGGEIRFSFRSGLSADPDRTWSEWTSAAAPPTPATPADSREIPLAAVPSGRYVQWRAEMEAPTGTPRITSVELSYRQENLSPRISRFGPLDAGEILVPTNFNPANQAFEPAHPNRDGIFTSLEPAAMLPDEVRLKTIWKKGSRTLRWESNDPNGDELRYQLWFRAEDEKTWLPMADDLKESFWIFDESSLPDGVYRFRLEASDREDNDSGDALVAEQVSEPVLVDSSPARLRSIRRLEPRGTVRVEVEDRLSPITEAVFSADGAEWQPAAPADGLLDGHAETFTITAPAGTQLLLLRITDAAFNLMTFDLSKEPS